MRHPLPLIGVLLFFCAFSVNAATVALDPLNSPEAGASIIQPGDLVTIQIVGGDSFPETVGGGVDISFDPDILQATGVNFTLSDFDFGNRVIDLDNGTGFINLAVGCVATTCPSGSFNIATVVFETEGVGVSELDLDESTFRAPWLTPAGVEIDVTYVDGSVTVVPLPAAAWLFLSAFGALGLLRRRTTPV